MSRGKARKTSTSPDEPTPAPSGNSFAALATTDQSGPAEPDEEEENAADDAGALSTSPASAATTTPGPSAEAVGEGSSLAEDILAAPSTLPAIDPVCVEMAAYLRKCVLDVTTPPAWVMELVLPSSRKPVGAASDKQMEEVRGAPQPEQNLDVVFERVQNLTTLAMPIQQQPSSSGSSCTCPPDHSQPARLTARTTSAVKVLPTDPLTARYTSAVGRPPTAPTTSALAPPSAHPNHNEHTKFSMKKSDVPPSLRLNGLPTEEVHEIMALFHSHIRLHAPDSTPDSVIDHHAVRYPAYLMTGGAASTMNQIQCET